MTSEISQSTLDPDYRAPSIGGYLVVGFACLMVGLACGIYLGFNNSCPTLMIPGNGIPVQNLQVQSTERKCYGWDTVDNERAWICNDGVAVCDDTRIKLPTHVSTDGGSDAEAST